MRNQKSPIQPSVKSEEETNYTNKKLKARRHEKCIRKIKVVDSDVIDVTDGAVGTESGR